MKKSGKSKEVGKNALSMARVMSEKSRPVDGRRQASSSTFHKDDTETIETKSDIKARNLEQMVSIVRQRLAHIKNVADIRAELCGEDVNEDSKRCSKEGPDKIAFEFKESSNVVENKDQKLSVLHRDNLLTTSDGVYIDAKHLLLKTKAQTEKGKKLEAQLQEAFNQERKDTKSKKTGAQHNRNEKSKQYQQARVEAKKSAKKKTEALLTMNMDGYITRTVNDADLKFMAPLHHDEIVKRWPIPVKWPETNEQGRNPENEAEGQMDPELLLRYSVQRINLPTGESHFRMLIMADFIQQFFVYAFWFVKVKFFQPDSTIDDETYLLRLCSQEYVRLVEFLSVQAHAEYEKDFTYKYLPYIFANAIYLGFYYLCPGSRHMYSKAFRKSILLQVVQLMYGIQLGPLSVKYAWGKLFDDDLPGEGDDTEAGGEQNSHEVFPIPQACTRKYGDTDMNSSARAYGQRSRMAHCTYGKPKSRKEKSRRSKSIAEQVAAVAHRGVLSEELEALSVTDSQYLSKSDGSVSPRHHVSSEGKRNSLNFSNSRAGSPTAKSPKRVNSAFPRSTTEPDMLKRTERERYVSRTEPLDGCPVPFSKRFDQSHRGHHRNQMNALRHVKHIPMKKLRDISQYTKNQKEYDAHAMENVEDMLSVLSGTSFTSNQPKASTKGRSSSRNFGSPTKSHGQGLARPLPPIEYTASMESITSTDKLPCAKAALKPPLKKPGELRGTVPRQRTEYVDAKDVSPLIQQYLLSTDSAVPRVSQMMARINPVSWCVSGGTDTHRKSSYPKERLEAINNKAVQAREEFRQEVRANRLTNDNINTIEAFDRSKENVLSHGPNAIARFAMNLLQIKREERERRFLSNEEKRGALGTSTNANKEEKESKMPDFLEEAKADPHVALFALHDKFRENEIEEFLNDVMKDVERTKVEED